MAIGRDEVLHVARLARLALTEEELDLDDVEPTSHPLELVNVWAEDELRPCLSLEEALANAPERAGDFFRVPGL